MDKFAYLIIGGIAGTLARYGLTTAIYQRFTDLFPWGTFTVNMIGCFIMGFCDVILTKKFALMPQMRLLLMAGFCGAFTTFSAYMLDTYNLIKAGETLRAFAYVTGSVAVGFIVFRLGMLLAEAL